MGDKNTNKRELIKNMKEKLIMIKMPENLHTTIKIHSASSKVSMNTILVDILTKFYKNKLK